MNDTEIIYRKLYQKYGESMSAREVMRELEIRGTRKLASIPYESLPRRGGGRQGVKVTYLTADVASYLIQKPPRKSRGYHVAMDARELSRFFVKHQLSANEKAGVIDAWNTALVYGDEQANIDLREVSALSGCDERLLRHLVKRGVPLNPLQSGVFEVAA